MGLIKARNRRIEKYEKATIDRIEYKALRQATINKRFDLD
jgi:hypothetical protein